ncbi:MAG: DUF6868 family protein [Sulfuricurvum sp.]
MDTIKAFLEISLAINYAILLVWFIAFSWGHEFLYRLHSRWFRLSVEGFDTVHYAGMAFYKVTILLFNLTPLLALCYLR